MKYRLRYRFRDTTTGEIISSAPNIMTTINKSGDVTMVHTRANKVVYVNEFKGIVLEVATHKHNGCWVYVAHKKDTYSLIYRIKQFIGRFK